MPLLPQQRFGIGQALMQGGQQMPQTGWGALASGLMQGLGGFVQGQGLAQQNTARQQLMQALMSGEQPGASPAATGGNREMLLQTLAQNPDLVPEFAAMKTALAGPKGAEESFDLKTVIGPSGKPTLVQYGNRGTIRPIEGYAPTPDKAGAPTIREFNVGDRVITKQLDPATGEWRVLSEAPRWNPASGPDSTSVNVTNIMPGEAKVPEALRTAYANYGVTLDQTESAYETLKKYNPDRAEALKGKMGLLSPEAAKAESAQNALLFNIAKLYEQGALQAPDKATAEKIIGDVFNPMLSQEARAAKYEELGKVIKTAKNANKRRVSEVAPEKSPVADVRPSAPAITPADNQAPLKPAAPQSIDDLVKKYSK